MKLHFTKMHGIGNDFVVFDAIHQRFELSEDDYRHIADRRFGIGCDHRITSYNVCYTKLLRRKRLEAEQRRKLQPLKNELKSLERQIADLQQRQQALEALLADSGLYETQRKAELKNHLADKAEVVITSYSIHYTKLYDWRAWHRNECGTHASLLS